MRCIDCGGESHPQVGSPTPWHDLPIDRSWQKVLDVLRPGPVPRPAQVLALDHYRVLESRRHLIIAAPTNGGKSLIGLLILLDAIRRGRRGVFLVPLRAIAREKAAELSAIAPLLAESLGRPFAVRLATGDYRLDDEMFADPPPAQGELLIATPERLEAILRNPAHDDWLRSIAAVCVDEAHLIGSRHRGPTLEYLLTSLLCLSTPPRIVLLSGTLGNVERAQEWLSPCDVVSVAERYPPLRKQVLELDTGEDANAVVVNQIEAILSDPDASVLIFVYQTRSTDRLASLLREVLGERAGCDGPLAYHSQMSVTRRESVRSSFLAGRCRCVVTTTALGLGVNLPATHVIIRDSTFPGAGALSLSDLLQIAGRAGRGDRAGSATVLVRPGDAWNADELARALRDEDLPGLVSHFEADAQRLKGRTGATDIYTSAIATHVATQLSRHAETGMSVEEVHRFFDASLGGGALASHVGDALTWLTDPTRVLTFQDEQARYRLTVLGQKATRAVLPLPIAAGIGQLVRDLLSLDPTDRLLQRWRPLDHLILLELMAERPFKGLRPFSKTLVEQVDAWMEADPERVPLLYWEWIVGQVGASRASEVLGSLGLHMSQRAGEGDEWARKEAYLAVFRSILLYEQGQGISIRDLERRWSVTGLEGIEERWRDERLWLLSGLAHILDVRSFYFHLREVCGADANRVQRVKRLLRQMRTQVFELEDHLKYCSPLGPALRSMRRTLHGGSGPSVGVQSIRRLEEAGVQSLSALAYLEVDDLVQLGIRRDLAHQIRVYVRRRLQ